jgi:hypothetical protein
MDTPTVALIPLVVGTVEAFKRTGYLSPKYAALVALALALLLVIGSFLLRGVGASSLADAIVQALAIGLSSSGLYSVAKAVVATPTPPGPLEGIARGQRPDA